MIQTVKINSDSTFEVNFGSYVVNSDLQDTVLPPDFISVLENIHNSLLAFGGSEVHSEQGSFSSFEHIRKGSEVVGNAFGQLISTQDFDWIMSQAAAVDLALNPPVIEQDTDQIDPTV